MAKTTLVPKEEAIKPGVANYLARGKTREEIIVYARKILADVQAWTDDPSKQQFIPQKPNWTPEVLEKVNKREIGTAGIFTQFEPADLEYYRSLIQAPLSMPERPMVYMNIVDKNPGQELGRYQEGFFSIKVRCPDATDASYMIGVPVPTELMCIMGLAWGLPKYLADEIGVTRSRGEVIYEGQVRISLDFVPDELPNSKTLETFVEGGTSVRFNPRTCAAPVLVGTRFRETHVFERRSGNVKVFIAPSDPIHRLVPENATFPGVYQRVLPGGQLRWKIPSKAAL